MSVDENEGTLQLAQSPASPVPAQAPASSPSPSDDSTKRSAPKKRSPKDTTHPPVTTFRPTSSKLPSTSQPDDTKVTSWAELPKDLSAASSDDPQLLPSSNPASAQQLDSIALAESLKDLKRRAESADPPETEASSSGATAPAPTSKRQRRTKATRGDKGLSSSSANPEQRASTAESEGNMGSERPRLTEQEKKNNHIASEQKRRMAIREGFDRLTEIVPGLEGQGRSESIVLKKSVDHMKDVLNERQQLIERIRALGGEIPPEFTR